MENANNSVHTPLKACHVLDEFARALWHLRVPLPSLFVLYLVLSASVFLMGSTVSVSQLRWHDDGADRTSGQPVVSIIGGPRCSEGSQSWELLSVAPEIAGRLLAAALVAFASQAVLTGCRRFPGNRPSRRPLESGLLK